MLHVLPAAAALLAALFEFGSGPAPSADFSVAPANPSAGTPIQFLDASTGHPTLWHWDFGDGTASTEPSPAHTFAVPGVYRVRLTSGNVWWRTTASRILVVSPEDTLRLIARHPFDVTLEARIPGTDVTGKGKAIPQNDIFGYFTLPELVPTAGPIVPEVFLKILDETPTGQDYWVFWGGLTHLEYTLTVREVETGATKTYRNPATESPACLGADTSGFQEARMATPAAPEPTPTVTPTAPVSPDTPTPTRTRSVPATPTPTRTPRTSTPTSTASRTPTPTRTASATATPSPGGPVVVRLRAVYWQWDFLGGSNTSSTPPYPGINTILLKQGVTYEFHIYNDGPVVDPPLPPHTFSGIAALGLSGAILQTGGAESVQTITPSQIGDFPFLCTLTECGPGADQHDAMHGMVRVVP
jgi:PKD repeat protein